MDREKNMPSNRNFGVTIGLVFLIIQSFLFFKSNNFYIYFLIVSALLLILGLINSKILYPFNKIWFNFGMLMSIIISPIILLIFFIFIFSPYGILGRIFSQDIKKIRNKKMNKYQSFWESDNNKNDYEKQY